jgi:hypothetical protein
MKKIVIFIQSICALFLLSACEDEFEGFVVNDSTPVVLSALTITDIELDNVNGNNPAATFNWTRANYGQQTVVNYAVQISRAANFANPYTVGTINSNTALTFSVAELNAAVGSIGLPPFAWNTVYARVVSSIGTQSGLPVASNVISFRVKPYFNYPYKDFYLVGNATQPGWNNNNNNPPLFRDSANSSLYNFVGYYGVGQFKVLEQKGLWQPQWGTNNGSGISVNPGGGSDPGSFPNNNNDIATAGYYKFTINYGTNTFTFTPYSITGATNYTSISVQGSSTSTRSMTRSSHDSHIWFANNIRLTPGNLNFLTNSGSVWGATNSFSGTATLNGGNIPVIVEDDYDIWFNDLTGHYIMIPLNL